MADFDTHVNDIRYVGPLKWIVCLLGDDIYSVNKFSLNHKAHLSRQQNMSISIMTLSAEAKRYHSKDYRTLCEHTKDGTHVNIVDKASADILAERFFSSMDVYPTDQKLFIREFFGTF